MISSILFNIAQFVGVLIVFYLIVMTVCLVYLLKMPPREDTKGLHRQARELRDALNELKKSIKELKK